MELQQFIIIIDLVLQLLIVVYKRDSLEIEIEMNRLGNDDLGFLTQSRRKNRRKPFFVF